MKDLLFSKLIIFVNKIFLESPELLFKSCLYFKSSENLEKILEDIMKHEEPR